VRGEETNPSFKKESNGLREERWHPIYTANAILDAIIPELKAARGDIE
jgi:hypothetical protein